jgi:FkbM family methyltransferase
MKTFVEDLRYDYPLTTDSVVIDAGVYEGRFSKTISEKYGCHVYAYEPVEQFYAGSLQNLSSLKKVHLFNHGLGAYARKTVFGIKGDMTGLFADATGYEIIRIENIELIIKYLTSTHSRNIDLLKLNVEGMEFEILESLAQSETVRLVKNIQVQPHGCAPLAAKRWEAIRKDLLLTHKLTYEAEWVWSNYELQV